MVCVTNNEGLDDTLGSANQRDGTPLTIIVSGSCLPPLEYPAKPTKKNRLKIIKLRIEKQIKLTNLDFQKRKTPPKLSSSPQNHRTLAQQR